MLPGVLFIRRFDRFFDPPYYRYLGIFLSRRKLGNSESRQVTINYMDASGPLRLDGLVFGLLVMMGMMGKRGRCTIYRLRSTVQLGRMDWSCWIGWLVDRYVSPRGDRGVLISVTVARKYDTLNLYVVVYCI